MIINAIILALAEIRRNMMRSALTILGIVIGVAAVITMVTLGKGASKQVSSEIESLGSNLLHVRPGQGFHGPGGVRSDSDQFKIEDAEAILNEVSGVKAVAPQSDSGIVAIYGSENWNTQVVGSDNSFLVVRNWSIVSGREFSENELRTGGKVCILGRTVAKKLFANSSPIGASIRLKRLSCKVIGTLTEKGQGSFGRDQDDMVLIPLVTFQHRISGIDEVQALMISAREGYSTEKVQAGIESLMRERRKIGPDDEDDFHVRDMKEIASALSGTTTVLTGLLGAVAAVSLLVGGIGIMNIMLVSVTERTREIGIRLAIGAQERDVLRQFLIEAIVLSACGGLLGIVFGLTLSAIIAAIIDFPLVFDTFIVMLSFTVSCIIGVVFGYFPALKAARLNPIEALRHE